jgi:coenzyme F420-reducing hydrogenase delta subunit
LKQIILYRCQNAGGAKKIINLPFVREFVLACAGELTAIHVLRPFEDKEKGVCIVHCDPAKCQTLEGCSRALARIKQAQKLLEEAGVSGKRVLAVKYEPGLNLEKTLSSFQDSIAKEA